MQHKKRQIRTNTQANLDFITSSNLSSLLKTEIPTHRGPIRWRRTRRSRPWVQVWRGGHPCVSHTAAGTGPTWLRNLASAWAWRKKDHLGRRVGTEYRLSCHGDVDVSHQPSKDPDSEGGSKSGLQRPFVVLKSTFIYIYNWILNSFFTKDWVKFTKPQKKNIYLNKQE